MDITADTLKKDWEDTREDVKEKFDDTATAARTTADEAQKKTATEYEKLVEDIKNR
jgi:hypothetical protein